MKRLAMVGILAAILADPSSAQDAILGMWKTSSDAQGNYGHVQMYDCDGQICGVIRKTFNKSGQEIPSDVIGKRMIWDMVARGDGTYGDGKVWAPDRNKTYASKMALSGRTLKVSGCVAGGLVCRDVTWTRAK